MRGNGIWWAVGLTVVAAAVGLLVTDPRGVLALAGVVLALCAVYVLTRAPAKTSVWLLAAAVPFMRPFILGERYATIGVALAVAAAGFALADGRLQRERSTRTFVFWMSLLWVWLTVQSWWDAQDGGQIARGWTTVWLVLVAAAVVLDSPARRQAFAKALTGLVVAACAAFAVTFALWLLVGFGQLKLGDFPIGYETNTIGRAVLTPVYFPLTPTYSSFTFAGLDVPRMLGLGRESGVMAVLIGWTWFTVRRVGWDRWWVKVLLLVGLLGTQSTAGFGVFLVVIVLERLFFNTEPRFWSVGLRRAFGVGVLAGALYGAYFAPLYGLQAKTVINEVSVSDRLEATVTGLRSLKDFPFGRAAEMGEVNSGINLIAAATTLGFFGVLFTALALLRPVMVSRPSSAGIAAATFVFLSVLTSQPPQFSTGFFLLTLLAALSLSGDGEAGERRLHGAAEAPLTEVHVAAPERRVGRDVGR